MGAVKSKHQNKSENVESIVLPNKGDIKNIRSKYILKKILTNLEQRKFLKLINYNNNIQKRFGIGINDYYNEFVKTIKFELILSNDCTKGTFINYVAERKKYHKNF